MTLKRDIKQRMITFQVRIPSEFVEEIEWRFIEPFQELLKGKVGELLEEYGWEYEEGETTALDAVDVQEMKKPLLLLKHFLHRVLIAGALGRNVKERVIARIIEHFKFEKKMALKAKEYMASYSHDGDKTLLSTQLDLKFDKKTPTMFDR